MHSQTSFGASKYDCVIKTRQVFNFFPLINNSFTVLLSFWLFCTSGMVSSNTISTLHFFPGLYS